VAETGSPPANPTVVWAFTDGKPGHESQTRGLVQALAERHPLDVHWIKLPAYASVVTSLMTRRFLPGAALPPPDLLIGAGHRTHLPLLAARRSRGGRTVVLMKPSLPRAWFDLCVIPAHDGISGANVVTTRGALNGMRPGEKNPRTGLILIGGPSRHHGWDEQNLDAQIEQLVTREHDIAWTLTTSRRTPARTVARLRALALPNLTVVPHEQTSRDWLPQQLAGSALAWVTEDSVSMVYEGLTAGCATGILDVPARRMGRVQRGVEDLAGAGLVTTFAQWQAGARPAPPAQPFNEAARVADRIVSQWLTVA
jgi:hypothetical protein